MIILNPGFSQAQRFSGKKADTLKKIPDQIANAKARTAIAISSATGGGAGVLTGTAFGDGGFWSTRDAVVFGMLFGSWAFTATMAASGVVIGGFKLLQKFRTRKS